MIDAYLTSLGKRGSTELKAHSKNWDAFSNISTAFFLFSAIQYDVI
jgi:hypothetical protein